MENYHQILKSWVPMLRIHFHCPIMSWMLLARSATFALTSIVWRAVSRHSLVK